ncbi:hypothetical protein OS493_029275 [Desmophyllum pertusum]|uniref:Uncharacterized protein n=1 Tax=Desmophyllum pertusum TaxID=174260 RepID=A0A9X0D3B1_9CNID|nr:hypothetical protein OS493_029275 [Desmophyllum pertusum]
MSIFIACSYGVFRCLLFKVNRGLSSVRRFCQKLTRIQRTTRADGHRRQLAVELEEDPGTTSELLTNEGRYKHIFNVSSEKINFNASEDTITYHWALKGLTPHIDKCNIAIKWTVTDMGRAPVEFGEKPVAEAVEHVDECGFGVQCTEPNPDIRDMIIVYGRDNAAVQTEAFSIIEKK